MTLRSVLERVEAACARTGRSPDEVTVVAVTKGRSVEEIETLYQQGHRHFGENRAQELAAKVDQLPADIRWHFVGPLQTNKVRMVRPATHLLHSMDRQRLANAWMKGPRRPPPALLQINIGSEPQKHGVAPGEAGGACERFLATGVPLTGVMAIPPLPEIPEDSRPHFVALRRIRDRLQDEYPAIDELSMGMTDDFEVAVEEGASMIRVGRAIFAG